MRNRAHGATTLSGHHSINHATTKSHDSCQRPALKTRPPVDRPISTERKSYNTTSVGL
jgi:hypothetical protein